MSKKPIADMNKINLVKWSYKSCLKNDQFLTTFYEIFLRKDHRIPEYFKNTNFDRQKIVLRNALDYMIMYAEGSTIAFTKIEDLGYRHDRNHLNIPVNLYSCWQDSLMETIENYDSEFNQEIKDSWIYVLSFGITKIKLMY